MSVEVEELKNLGWKHIHLRNTAGMVVSFLDWGGTITAISPEKENLVLRYESLEQYKDNPAFLGALIGPVAGRIENASYSHQDETVVLSKNENNHHLHGGEAGFHKRVWEVRTWEDVEERGAVLKLYSSEDGYPGEMEATVKYTLTDSNEFIIDYEVEVSEERPVALTNHTYFNFSGEDVRNHRLTLPSSTFLELDEELIPTGKALEASGTFDFRNGKLLKDGFIYEGTQHKAANGGYDHFFFLDEAEFNLEGEGDQSMRVKTDQPGVVIYTSNNFPEQVKLDEKAAAKYAGVCLETQIHPLSLKHERFPKVVVQPSETWNSRTSFKF